MMVKYILHDGFVRSRSDGQLHYIGPMRLAFLYGVNLRDCVVYPSGRHEFYGWREPEDAVHLYPRNDGNYTLPK